MDILHLFPSERPGKIRNLVGQRFGLLTVIRFVGMHHHPPSQNKPVWLCRCDCGQECLRQGNSLAHPQKEPSCGCRGQQRGTDPSIPIKFPKEYQAWRNMWDRCTNPNNQKYSDYGERGITIDPRWRSFKTFITDMGERPGSIYSIERIQNDYGYSKENCRWATKREQTRNTRRNHWATYKGVTKCLQDWSIDLGISWMTLRYRIKSGFPEDQVFAQVHYTNQRKRILESTNQKSESPTQPDNEDNDKDGSK